MSKKKRNNVKKTPFIKRSFRIKHSSVLVFSVLLLIVCMSLLLIYQPSVGVGKAYQAFQVTDVGDISNLGVYFPDASSYSSPADIIDIPIKLKKEGLLENEIRGVQFCLRYSDFVKFEVVGNGFSNVLNNWAILKPGQDDNANWLVTEGEVGEENPCPAGYTDRIEFGSGAGVTGLEAGGADPTLANLKVRVVNDAVYSDGGTDFIEILPMKVTGPGNFVHNFGNEDSSQVQITIVPRCGTVDVDNDDYPNAGLTFDAFNDNLGDDLGDWRGCANWDSNTMYIDGNGNEKFDDGETPTLEGIADCDDADAEIFPGNSEICDGKNNDCDVGTADGSDEQAPLNSKQQGVCFGTYRTCQSDGLGGASMKDTWPPEYNVVEQCDFVDHDCDGNPITHTSGEVVTEIEECQIGGSIALPFDAGNLYPTWEGNEPAENQDVNLFDLHIESLYQDLSVQLNAEGDNDYKNGKPLCGHFLTGYLCVCKNGNHAFTTEVDGTDVKTIDYVGQQRNDFANVIVDPVDLIMKQNNDENPDFETIFMGCNE